MVVSNHLMIFGRDKGPGRSAGLGVKGMTQDSLLLLGGPEPESTRF